MEQQYFLDETEFRTEWFSGYRKIMEAFLRNQSFQDVKSAVFQITISKIAYFLSKNRAIHFFINPNKHLGKFNKGLLHYMVLDNSEDSEYQEFSVKDDQPIFGSSYIDDNFWDNVNQFFLNFQTMKKIETNKNGSFWDELFEKFDDIGRPLEEEIIFIRLSDKYNNEKYNMGFALFWNDKMHRPLLGPNHDDELFLMYIDDLRKIIISNLRQFGKIESRTYLPDYKKTGNKTVSLMFCGIKNINAFTQILRNKNRLEKIKEFINNYSQTMNEVISRYGRIDKLMGDSILAVFGEYTESKSEMCAKALLCAREMINEFKKDTKVWLIEGFDKEGDYRKLQNEFIDLDLSIGLNVGEVIFDYFGSDDLKVYSAIGDHVNFAQNLKSLALQVSGFQTGERNDPIIMSQAFYHNSKDEYGNWFFNDSYLKDTNRNRAIFAQLNCLGIRYPIYTIKESDINDHELTNLVNRLND